MAAASRLGLGLGSRVHQHHNHNRFVEVASSREKHTPASEQRVAGKQAVQKFTPASERTMGCVRQLMQTKANPDNVAHI